MGGRKGQWGGQKTTPHRKGLRREGGNCKKGTEKKKEGEEGSKKRKGPRDRDKETQDTDT